MVLWLVCAALCCLAAALALRIFFMNKCLDEMMSSFKELLSEDTNVLITLSHGGKPERKFAAELNKCLRELKSLRRMYLNGDRELKAAVTNISHDLRTPLTAISGYLELLDREEKSENVGRYIGRIKNRTEAMKRLTEELFRYSVIISTSDSLDTAPVDVAAVLEECVAGFYGALTERGIEPEITIPEEKIVKNLNRDALSRIYGNIIGNALKYSDGDLKIVMHPDGAAEFSNTAENLSGVDVGRLFDRFFSVEAASNSTGLGLAISKTLAEQMNGGVSAKIEGRTLTVRVDWSVSPEGHGF